MSASLAGRTQPLTFQEEQIPGSEGNDRHFTVRRHGEREPGLCLSPARGHTAVAFRTYGAALSQLGMML